MVSSVASPPLTPTESTLLVALIALDYDLQALIKAQSLAPEQAIDFISSAAVQRTLSTVRRFTDLSDHLYHSKRRRKAVDALALVIDKQSTPSGDPIELRKAATSLLRRTEPPQTKGARATDRGSARSVSSLPTLSEAPFGDDAAAFSCSSPAAGGGGVALRDGRGGLRSPRLDSSPQLIIASLANAASTNNTEDSVAILSSCLADDAWIGDEPLSPTWKRDSQPGGLPWERGRRPAPVDALINSIAHVTLSYEGSATSTTIEVLAIAGGGRTTHVFLDFALKDPTAATERWRITRIRGASPPPHLPKGGGVGASPTEGVSSAHRANSQPGPDTS